MKQGFIGGQRALLVLQGLYYVITGIWPWLHMGSFMVVTGPKTDLWLVKMVGLLAFTSGSTLLFGASGKNSQRVAVFHGVLSALAFFAVDVIYGLNGTISPVYLADAMAQAVLIIAHAALLVRRRRMNSMAREFHSQQSVRADQ